MQGLTRCALLLAAIAASTPALAQTTEVTLGGYFAGSLRSLDSDFEPNEQNSEGINNASYLNLKASLKTETLTGFAVYERGGRNDKAGIEPDRLLYLGLDTAAGQFTLGQKASEFRLAGERLDPFYDTGVAGFNGRAMSEGASYGLSNLTNAFSRNGLNYVSPVLAGGLQVNAGAYLGTKDAPNDKTDLALGAVYTLPDMGGEGNALNAGVQYLKIENGSPFALGNSRRNDRVPVGGTPGVSDNFRVHAAYTTPKYSVGVSLEHIDVKAERDARGYFYLAGSMAVSETTRVAASYGKLDFKTGSPLLSGDGYSLGLFRKLGESVNGYVAARQVSLDGPGDTVTIAGGLSIRFKVKLYPSDFNFGGGDGE